MFSLELTEYLKEEGWTIHSFSPLEISHADGSMATGLAARMVISYLERELMMFGDCFKADEL